MEIDGLTFMRLPGVYTFYEAKKACPAGWRLPASTEVLWLICGSSWNEDTKKFQDEVFWSSTETWGSEDGLHIAAYNLGARPRPIEMFCEPEDRHAVYVVNGRQGSALQWVDGRLQKVSIP